ncbi:MAG: glycerophosphodiester phosphodiesterase [Ruminococcus sp.]|nr:glycerophosphodiester phosphodiesterase [Ruminococcus sp.]
MLPGLTAAYKYSGHEIYFDAKIPLLSEVLEEVGDDILLNIEIKDTGDTALTTEKTVELVREYGLESACYITSFSYSVLKKVKQLEPKIKTGLIANTAATAFTRLENVDAISINYLLASPSVVNMAHQNGKRVFVWTVDNEEDMKKMIALGVDNIITNRPDKAAKLVYSRNIGSWVLNLLETIFT